MLGIELIIPLLGYPQLVGEFYQRLMGSSDVPVVIKRADDSTYPVPPVQELLNQVRALPDLGWGNQVVILPFMATFVRLRDDLKKGGVLHDDDPLIRFVRHLGNASAHGNRWNFEGREPAKTAAFRSFRLDRTMHGERALFGTLLPGDCFDLIDDVIAWLA